MTELASELCQQTSSRRVNVKVVFGAVEHTCTVRLLPDIIQALVVIIVRHTRTVQLLPTIVQAQPFLLERGSGEPNTMLHTAKDKLRVDPRVTVADLQLVMAAYLLSQATRDLSALLRPIDEACTWNKRSET